MDRISATGLQMVIPGGKQGSMLQLVKAGIYIRARLWPHQVCCGYSTITFGNYVHFALKKYTLSQKTCRSVNLGITLANDD